MGTATCFFAAEATAHGLNGVAAAQMLAFDALGFGGEGTCVALHASVEQVDDTVGVPLGQIGVVCDHDDQTFAGDLADEVHDLYARRCIERPCRFICK